MAYVITQNCCKDASCVPACPVDCIRPADGAQGTQMLFIDPETCIDCGACVDECPVDAIYSEYDLPPDQQRFRELNAAYFQRHPLEPGPVAAPPQQRAPVGPGALRVAIVGAGPAACYAATGLLSVDGVEVDLFDRLPTPFGLVRFGVAPDHQRTKSVVKAFDNAFRTERFACHLGVEIGSTLTHQDLLAHHHAVVYAIGAPASRDLGIPGEHLPGHHAAADFVGWYNGHPDHAAHLVDLTGRRAVITGNGNVALDIARMLLAGPVALAATDIAEHALAALSEHRIEEVVILGRRGPREAAFSVGEFSALGHLDGVDVVLDDADLTPHPDDDVETAAKLALAREYRERPATQGNKRITFRFHTAPVEFVGTERVEALRVTGATEPIETGLVFRSIGYLGRAVDGVPYDARTGTIPHRAGRVVDAAGVAIPGVYATGWIKRGPRGVIGTNRGCAAETVAGLLADHANGSLDRPVADRRSLLELMAEREIAPVDWPGWRAIDAAERARGAAVSRPRVKLVSVEELLETARRR
ncbi:FAD-dependent oxidoreductase [Nocardia sp. NPDC050378]|uniref:FAD-dependent oxidoreductase n=1 Tax=Nocardia sp. NPDC050378 TaxID=3155400 RepID=UPI0033E999D2